MKLIRFILLALILTISLSSKGQFYKISFNDPKSKEEVIQDLSERNSFFRTNQYFFFKGTIERKELKCNDSTLQHCTFYRKSLFGSNGEIVSDSIVNKGKTSTSKLFKIDTTWIKIRYLNAIETNRDTFILDRNLKIRVIKEPKQIITFDYDETNRLKCETTKVTGQVTKKEINYDKNSIIVTETESNKFENKILKRFYFFKKGLMTKDSTITLSYRYRPPDFTALYSIDTTYNCSLYAYDKNKRHIETTYRSSTFKPSRFERNFQKGKVLSEINFSSDNQVDRKTIFEYPDHHTIIENEYTGDRFVIATTYKFINGKICEAKQVNNTFEIKQGKLIELDNKGRIILSNDFFEQENDWRRNIYIDKK